MPTCKYRDNQDKTDNWDLSYGRSITTELAETIHIVRSSSSASSSTVSPRSRPKKHILPFGCFGVRSSRAGGWRPRVLQLEFFGGVAVALAGKQAKAGVGKFATLSNTAPTHARSATVAQLAGRYPSHQPSRARATISTASTTNHPRPQQSAHLASRHTSDSPRAPNDLAQLAQRTSPLPLPTHRRPTRAQQSASRHPTCLLVAQFACAHGSQPTD